jgi:hypothetical protein
MSLDFDPIASAKTIIASDDVEARRALFVMVWMMPESKRERIMSNSDWSDFAADMFHRDRQFASHFFVEPHYDERGVVVILDPPAPWKQVLEISEAIHLV